MRAYMEVKVGGKSYGLTTKHKVKRCLAETDAAILAEYAMMGGCIIDEAGEKVPADKFWDFEKGVAKKLVAKKVAKKAATKKVAKKSASSK